MPAQRGSFGLITAGLGREPAISAIGRLQCHKEYIRSGQEGPRDFLLVLRSAVTVTDNWDQKSE